MQPTLWQPMREVMQPEQVTGPLPETVWLLELELKLGLGSGLLRV